MDIFTKNKALDQEYSCLLAFGFFWTVFFSIFTALRLGGALAFSLLASAIYINNDISDIESDRKHPTKSSRPLASGSISKRSGYIAIIILSVCSIVLSCLISLKATTVLFIYAVINIAYSRGLKHRQIVDIVIVALGFVLRVIYGGYCCNTPISLWLFLTVFSFALYFALGKRRGELKCVGTMSRESLLKYSESFLEKGMTIFLTCGIMFMSLWAFEKIPSSISYVSLDSLLVVLGIPLVMLICLLYSYDIDKPNCDGDPVNVLLSDKLLVLITLLCLVVTFLSLYL